MKKKNAELLEQGFGPIVNSAVYTHTTKGEQLCFLLGAFAAEAAPALTDGVICKLLSDWQEADFTVESDQDTIRLGVLAGLAAACDLDASYYSEIQDILEGRRYGK